MAFQLPFGQQQPNSGSYTPADVERRRRMAEALASDDFQAREPFGAIAKALIGARSGYEMEQAEEIERQGITDFRSQLGAVLADPNRTVEQLTGLASNPWATGAQGQLAMQLLGDELKPYEPDWQTIESGGDVLRWDQNNPDARPEMFFDGPDASGSGPYAGNGMEAQNWNIVLTGDPSSPAYAAAYSQLTQPKLTFQETADGAVPVWSSPQLPPSIRPPTGALAASGATMHGPGGVPTGGAAVDVGAPIPGTAPRPTDAMRRMGALSDVVAPDAALVLGDGTPQNPGVFDALASLTNQAAGMEVGGGKPGFGLAAPEYQRAINALTNIAQSYLYAMSGQAAPAEEVKKIVATMLPVPFESAQSIADKKARVATYVRAIQAGTGVNLDDPSAEPLPTATNPETGEQVVYVNGQWVPIDQVRQ